MFLVIVNLRIRETDINIECDFVYKRVLKIVEGRGVRFVMSFFFLVGVICWVLGLVF